VQVPARSGQNDRNFLSKFIPSHRRYYRSKKEDLKDVAKIQADPVHSAGQYHKTGVPEMLSGAQALSSVYKL
jgi:hypothetical protein